MRHRSWCKKIIAVVLTVATLLTVNVVSVSAIVETCPHGYCTFNDQQLSGGVGQYGSFRRYYWRSGNVDAYWSTYVSSSFDRWVNTSANPGVTTSISFRSTSVKADATIEIMNDVLNGSTTGYTEFYIYSTKIEDPSSRNWGWAIIKYDSGKTQSYSQEQKIGLICHELGHAMGLSHQPEGALTSIMYSYDRGRFLNHPSVIDCNTINHIYG